MGDGQKRIAGIGGLDNGHAWAMSRNEAAAFITGGEKSFFVVAPDGNNVEALYRDVGDVGHHASPKLR